MSNHENEEILERLFEEEYVAARSGGLTSTRSR